MAADAMNEPISVLAVEANLRKLLVRAREVKVANSLEPAVPASEIRADVALLFKDVFAFQPDSFKFVVVETAARKVFYDLVHTTDISSPQFIHVWDLLDVLIVCGEQRQCESILPFYLIEELLETQTTDCCRIVFNYLESRRERLMKMEFHKTHLVILRACNELLRRLSRAEDAVFCGRVFFFLFQAFPLGDKSSVNLRGEYHVDNITTFEMDLEPLPVTDEPAGSMEVDAAPGRQNAEEVTDLTTTAAQENQKPAGVAVVELQPSSQVSDTQDDNSKLYPIFWRLQQDFTVPTRLFNEEHFTVFKEGLESTMDRFRKTPVVVQTRAASEDQQRGTKRKLGQSSGEQLNNNYNPKYLTSRDLFELELSDLAFQRHILVQALILIDFLLSLTEKAKKKITDANITKINTSLIYPYVLSDENREWVISTRSKITSYLQQGPDGNFYYRMVNTVISRDKNWVRWKIENCTTVVIDAVLSDHYAEARSSARQATTSRRIKAKPMGAIDLTFLSEADNAKGLERLRDSSRFAAPPLDALIKGIANDELDLEMAMTDDEKQSLEILMASKSWRAMRIASRTTLGKLDKVENGKRLQDVFKSEVASDVVDIGSEPPAIEGKTLEVDSSPGKT